MDPVLNREVEVCQQDLAILEHFVHCLRILGSVARLEVIDRQVGSLLAMGCNIGPTRMAGASELSVWEISQAADWYLTECVGRAKTNNHFDSAELTLGDKVHSLGEWCSG
jgi:hypothetical protein